MIINVRATSNIHITTMGAIKDIYDIIGDITSKLRSRPVKQSNEDIATVAAELKSRVEQLERDHAVEVTALKQENEHLVAENLKLQPPSDISDIAIKILNGLFNHGPCGDTERFRSELGIQESEVEFYFDELKQRKLVSKRGIMMGANGIVPVTACITTDGRNEVMRRRKP